MFERKIFGINFGVTFSFFAVAALIFPGEENVMWKFVSGMSCCFFHEVGHLFFMVLFGEKPESIILYGGGIKIVPSVCCCFRWQEVLILLGGCIFNFIGALFWFFAVENTFFCSINIFLAIFNLLPFSYFDGGRVLQMIFRQSISFIIRFLFIIGMIAVAVLMFVNGNLNVSFAVVVGFVIFSDLICEICPKFKKTK